MDGNVLFQYFSDVHLEMYQENIPKIKRLFINPILQQTNRPKLLLLPGDIGNPLHQSYTTFLQELSPLYEKIFITTGNHEYHRMRFQTMFEVDNHCREICRNMPQNNVIFLQNDNYFITDNLAIFGATFWTHIPDSKHDIINNSINDYINIPDFTPTLCSTLHNQSISKLSNLIYNHSSDNVKWIVMSHHLPSFSLIEEEYKKYNHTTNHAFASEIDIAQHHRIIAWVYGHTHTPKQHNKFYCNPIGYPGENKEWSLFKHFSV